MNKNNKMIDKVLILKGLIRKRVNFNRKSFLVISSFFAFPVGEKGIYNIYTFRYILYNTLLYSKYWNVK